MPSPPSGGDHTESLIQSPLPFAHKIQCLTHGTAARSHARGPSSLPHLFRDLPPGCLVSPRQCWKPLCQAMLWWVHSDSPERGSRECQATLRSRHNGQDGFDDGVSCLPPHPVRMSVPAPLPPGWSRQRAGLIPHRRISLGRAESRRACLLFAPIWGSHQHCTAGLRWKADLQTVWHQSLRRVASQRTIAPQGRSCAPLFWVFSTGWPQLAG